MYKRIELALFKLNAVSYRTSIIIAGRDYTKSFVQAVFNKSRNELDTKASHSRSSAEAAPLVVPLFSDFL